MSHASLEGTFDGLYGLRVVEAADGLVRAEVDIEDRLRQPAGLLHGGVLASMAESMASAATYLAVAGEGKTAMGLSNSTSFLRPFTEGTVHGTARVRHRGRTTWIWDVEFTDDQDRVCALSRMTIATRGSGS